MEWNLFREMPNRGNKQERNLLREKPNNGSRQMLNKSNRQMSDNGNKHRNA